MKKLWAFIEKILLALDPTEVRMRAILVTNVSGVCAMLSVPWAVGRFSADPKVAMVPTMFLILALTTALIGQLFKPKAD